jgi:predicted tellurium resistance membrane protein TerC
MLQFHLIIVVAVVLVIIGVVKLMGSNPTEADTKLPKAGVVILIVCWAILVVGTAASFGPSQYERPAPAYRSGTKVFPPPS